MRGNLERMDRPLERVGSGSMVACLLEPLVVLDLALVLDWLMMKNLYLLVSVSLCQLWRRFLGAMYLPILSGMLEVPSRLDVSCKCLLSELVEQWQTLVVASWQKLAARGLYLV